MPLNQIRESADLMSIDITAEKTIVSEIAQAVKKRLMIFCREPLVIDFLIDSQKSCNSVRYRNHCKWFSWEVFREFIVGEIVSLWRPVVTKHFNDTLVDDAVRQILCATSPAIVKRYSLKFMKKA